MMTAQNPSIPSICSSEESITASEDTYMLPLRPVSDKYKIVSQDGWTALVYSVPPPYPETGPHRACKVFNNDCIPTHYPVEREAYQRFTAAENRPSSILNYYGKHADFAGSIVLDLAENGNLLVWMNNQRTQGLSEVAPITLVHWATQAALGLGFAHGLGVCNSDIHPVNLFLDRNMNLKVGDWAGASIDGSESHSSYRLRFRLFDADGTDVPRERGISPATEVFALGTAMYYMVTGHEPWPELSVVDDCDVIKQKISNREFPDTSSFRALGAVIAGCWNGQFESMADVKKALDVEWAAMMYREKQAYPLLDHGLNPDPGSEDEWVSTDESIGEQENSNEEDWDYADDDDDAMYWGGSEHEEVTDGEGNTEYEEEYDDEDEASHEDETDDEDDSQEDQSEDDNNNKFNDEGNVVKEHKAKEQDVPEHADKAKDGDNAKMFNDAQVKGETKDSRVKEAETGDQAKTVVKDVNQDVIENGDEQKTHVETWPGE